MPRRPAAGQDPAPEGDRLAGRVEDREDHPAPEAVAQAVLALVGEARLHEQVPRGSERPHERPARLGRPAEAELAHGLALVAPRAQVLAGPAGVRVAEHLLVVEGDGLLHDCDQGLATLSRRARPCRRCRDAR